MAMEGLLQINNCPDTWAAFCLMSVQFIIWYLENNPDEFRGLAWAGLVSVDIMDTDYHFIDTLLPGHQAAVAVVQRLHNTTS